MITITVLLREHVKCVTRLLGRQTRKFADGWIDTVDRQIEINSKQSTALVQRQETTAVKVKMLTSEINSTKYNYYGTGRLFTKEARHDHIKQHGSLSKFVQTTIAAITRHSLPDALWMRVYIRIETILCYVYGVETTTSNRTVKNMRNTSSLSTCQVTWAACSAWSRSPMRLSVSSSPTERRI